MKILISEEQAKFIFGQKYICPKCKHTWEIEKKDKDPKLCHWCGWDDEENTYDDNKLLTFWEKESKKDQRKLNWVEENKIWGKKEKKSSLVEEIQKILQESLTSGTPTWELIAELFEGILKKGEKESLTQEEKKLIVDIFEKSNFENKPERQFAEESENVLTKQAFEYFRKNFSSISEISFIKTIYPQIETGIKNINYTKAKNIYKEYVEKLVEKENCDYCQTAKEILDLETKSDLSPAQLVELEEKWNVLKQKRNLQSPDNKLGQELETEVDKILENQKKLNEYQIQLTKMSPNENVVVKIDIKNKFSESDLSKKISEAIRTAIQSNPTRKVETSNIESTFKNMDEDIYNPKLANTEFYDENGLNKKFVEALNKEKPNFLKNLKNGKYQNVLDADGNWSPLNKLDTNQGDKIALFSDYVQKEIGKNIDELSEEEFNQAVGQFINDCKKNPEKINGLIDANVEKYTTNILKNTEVGDVIEQNFINRIQEIFPDSKIVFRGTNGNALDKAGIDAWMKNSDGTYVPLQFKKGNDLKITSISDKPSGVEKNEGYSVFVSSAVYLKSGYLGVEDGLGNWILFPPQQLYTAVDKILLPNGKYKVTRYEMKTDKFGNLVQGFNSGSKRTHYIDVLPDVPGKEVYVGFQQPTDLGKKIDIEFDKPLDTDL